MDQRDVSRCSDELLRTNDVNVENPRRACGVRGGARAAGDQQWGAERRPAPDIAGVVDSTLLVHDEIEDDGKRRVLSRWRPPPRRKAMPCKAVLRVGVRD